jgi:hypothetical protein
MTIQLWHILPITFLITVAFFLIVPIAEDIIRKLKDVMQKHGLW